MMKRRDEDEDEDDENSNVDGGEENKALIRDLEIEAFSSSNSIDFEKCVEVLRSAQELYDLYQTKNNKLQVDVKTIENSLLDYEISYEKAFLESKENSRLLNQLENEKEELQEKYRTKQASEEEFRKEYVNIDPVYNELEKHVEDIESLNQEIVTSELDKRRMELGVINDDLDACMKELDLQKTVFSDASTQYNNTHTSYENALCHLQERKNVFKKINETLSSKEKKFQIDSTEQELLLKREELQCLENEVNAAKSRLLEENFKCVEAEKLQDDANHKLAVIQKEKNNLDDEVASLSKHLSLAQAKQHSHATTRMQLEIDLRDAKESLRHETASVALNRKQLDRMKRLFLKKKRINEKTSELLVQIKASYRENEGLIKAQLNDNDQQFESINRIKDEMNVKITRLMEQHHVEDKVKEEYHIIYDAVEEKEREIDRWKSEVKKLNKIESILNVQCEAQMRKRRNVISNQKETLEMIKIKKMMGLDMEKVLRETKKRAMELTALFDVLKTEKNHIEGAISISILTLKEMRKKVEDHDRKLYELSESNEMKKMILEKERDSFNCSKVVRVNLRVEKTKLRSILRKKKEETNSLDIHISKLQSALASLKKESNHLRVRNGTLEKGKRLIAEQLDDKKIEIHKLLQRANAYEEALTQGDLVIQHKNEDTRILRLECSNIERYIATKSTLESNLQTHREKLVMLENELTIEKDQVIKLSIEIEKPGHNNWHELGGVDLDDEQLDAKIELLKQRLSEGREQILEREVSLEETKSNKLKLQARIKDLSESAQPTIKKLNEYRVRLNNMTRSMMALVSELSMYQAIALQLEEEIESQEESLQQSRQLVKEGKAPNDDALNDLRRLLRARKIDSNSIVEDVSDKFGHVYYPAEYALRTTCAPRPNAYIPDSGIEVPKPFGTIAPFKASNTIGTTIRRIWPSNFTE